MSTTFSRTLIVERGPFEYEVECEFEVYSWGCGAQTYGPPENCYPAEGPELVLTKAFIQAPPWALGKWKYNEIPFALTDAERWNLEEKVCEDPPEPDYGYED